MASKLDWLDAGLEILTEQGARALTIDNLTARLTLTKGSFYHHFKGIGGFKTALLTHFEAGYTTRFIDEAEAAGAPVAKLERLLDLVVANEDHALEAAIRAWALQDAEVRTIQERVDQTRIGYLRSVCTEITGDARDAARTAYALYLILIGAGHVMPAVPTAELGPIYELILTKLITRPLAGRNGT